MNRPNVKKLLSILKAKNIDDREDWVRCSCIFARHRHKGTDANPSAGIFVTSGGTSFYHCFGCGTSGPISNILFELLSLNRAAGIESPQIPKALAFLEDEDVFSYDPEEYTEDVKQVSPFPEKWLGSFSKLASSPRGLEYVKGRRVPDQVIEDFDLRFDNALQAVGFPYKDKLGRIAGMRGRLVDGGHHDYSYNKRNNTQLVWFRESTLDADKPLVVVEGQFDNARVYQQYRNVTALLTAHAAIEKLSRLLVFPEILWMSDNDTAGGDSWEAAREYYHGKVPITRIDFSAHGVKDPDALPAHAIKYLLREYVDLDPLLVDKKDDDYVVTEVDCPDGYGDTVGS